MDRIASELGLAQSKYNNIDKELERDDKVARLNRELYFFREECVYQHQQNEKLKKEVARLKSLNESLTQEKHEIRSVLFKKRLMQASGKLTRIGDSSMTPTTPMSPLLSSSNGRYSRGLPNSTTVANPEQWIQMRSKSFNKSSMSDDMNYEKIASALSKIETTVQAESDNERFALI